MGTTGDSEGGALAESVMRLFGTGVISPRGSRKQSIDAVEYATLERVNWFNRPWLPGPIGYMPPAELDQAYYR